MSKKISNAEKVKQLLAQKGEEVQEKKEEAKKVEELESLPEVVYVVQTNPKLKGRNYLISKLKYDIVSKKALVVETRTLVQKEVGMRFPTEQQNLKYFYEKSAKLEE